MCGFNSAIVFKDIDDDDIEYVEKFARTKLQNLVEDVEHPSDSSCFFGSYSSQQASFKFTVGEKWLIKQIQDHINKVIESEKSDGLLRFKYSPYDSKLDIAVEPIPYFCNRMTKKTESPITTQKTYGKPVILDKLIAQAEKNDTRDKHGHRYDEDVMNVASYWRLVCGKLGYQSLQSNLQSALPSISSTDRFISKSDGYITEGVLRVYELKCYLKQRQLPNIVALSEDATRITGRIQYDSKSNEIIGFALPFDNVTGMPIPHSYQARSAEEILRHFSNANSIANHVYVVMAQPLADVAPFCLMVFGSDAKFTAENVINR